MRHNNTIEIQKSQANQSFWNWVQVMERQKSLVKDGLYSKNSQNKEVWHPVKMWGLNLNLSSHPEKYLVYFYVQILKKS